jgi:hypothetical protein
MSKTKIICPYCSTEISRVTQDAVVKAVDIRAKGNAKIINEVTSMMEKISSKVILSNKNSPFKGIAAMADVCLKKLGGLK